MQENKVKKLAFVIPHFLQEDGALQLEEGKQVRLLTGQLKQKYEITYIVRRIRQKKYDEVPEEEDLLYDSVVPRYSGGIQETPEQAVSRSYLYYSEWAEQENITEREFDCVIAFDGISPWCLATALHRIKAARRIVWFHKTPELYLMPEDAALWKRIYGQFAGICVSTEAVKEGFCRIFPDSAQKVELIPHILDEEEYKDPAAGDFENPYHKDCLNLLTAGRLNVGSGIEKIPAIAAEMKRCCPRIRWFILGNGDMRNHILRQIILQDVCEEVILLDKKENRYPYIQNCDIYAALSDPAEDEAAMTAMAMKKPVFSISKGRLQAERTGEDYRQTMERLIEGAENDPPLISVIVPIYNNQEWLGECIRSIRRQTIKDIEIILVDDGSTDYSGVICDAYAEEDNRIRVIHQKKQGVSAARNAGIRRAGGNWLMFCDSDDYVMPEWCEILVQLGSRYPDAWVCTGKAYADNQSRIYEKNIYNQNEELSILFREQYMDSLKSRIGNTVYTQIFDAQTVKACHIWFDEQFSYGEDTKFAMTYWKQKKYGVVYNGEPPYVWRHLMRDSLSTRFLGTLYFESIRALLPIYKSMIPKDREEELLKWFWESISFRSIGAILDARNPDSVEKQIEDCQRVMDSAEFQQCMAVVPDAFDCPLQEAFKSGDARRVYALFPRTMS